jgi:hypothetical protein
MLEGRALQLRRIRSERKGLETILAALLMVVIVMVMSVMIYTWSTGVFGAILPAPASGREILVIENQAFNNNNVTLFLRNTGTTTVTLASYYVQDMNGNQYSRSSWSGPVMSPTGLGQANVQIQPQCSSTACPLTGSAFTFKPGSSYTIIIVTTRNNQFTFSLLR